MDCFSCVSCLIGNIKVAASEVVEDIEDMRESRRMLACAAKTAAGAPSYAAVTRTLLLLPQTRPTKQARRPSDASNVSHTVNMTAPIKVVDTPPNFISGTQNTDVATDTDKEVATSVDSEAAAIPVAAISSRLKRPQLTMQLRDWAAYLQNMSKNSTKNHFHLLPHPPFPYTPIRRFIPYPNNTSVLQVEKARDSILTLN